eukprot:scaffold135926_cov15-Tisochrysis_lutea.AAC.1
MHVCSKKIEVQGSIHLQSSFTQLLHLGLSAYKLTKHPAFLTHGAISKAEGRSSCKPGLSKPQNPSKTQVKPMTLLPVRVH